MAKSTTPEALAELQTLLRDTAKTAPPRTASVYETVKSLLPDIKELKAKRFTDQQIRDLFVGKGLDISLGTFRQYLQRANREAGVAPTRKPPTKRAKKEVMSEPGQSEKDANANANAKPKPSEMAPAPRAKAGTGAKATGHRLNDGDL